MRDDAALGSLLHHVLLSLNTFVEDAAAIVGSAGALAGKLLINVQPSSLQSRSDVPISIAMRRSLYHSIDVPEILCLLHDCNFI